MSESGVRTSPAFITSKVPFRDNDLILGLMTRNEGPVSVIARSARNSRRRFAGLLDFFIVLDASWAPGRGSLDGLVGVEPIRFFPGIYESLERLQAGQSILQAIRNVSRDAPLGAAIFDQLMRSFGELELASSETAHLVLLDAVFALSVEVGHAPVDGICPLCGRAETTFVIDRDGIFACRGCCQRAGAGDCVVTFGGLREPMVSVGPVFKVAGGATPGPADVSMIVESILAGITGHHSSRNGPECDQAYPEHGKDRQGQPL